MNINKIKYFESFAGVSGMGLGIDGECVGFSEIDPHANQVLKHNQHHVKNYGNISKINWNTVPDFSLFVGGSPCQDLSIAGKRAGLGGERSGLFSEYIRALKEKQPDHFIWENVKGALSSGQGWDFAEVLSSFSEVGYSFGWQVLNAKHFGVPQNRERIFITGTRGECAREVFFERQSPDENSDEAIEQGIATTLTGRGAGGQNRRGNYIIQLNNPTHSNNRIYAIEGIAPTLNTSQVGNRQPFVLIPEATRLGYAIASEGDSINLANLNSRTRRGRVGVRVAQTLDTGMQQYTLQHGRVRRLTPKECERLMSWPDEWTLRGVDKEGGVIEISDSQRYKMCGNGVVSVIIKVITEKLL